MGFDVRTFIETLIYLIDSNQEQDLVEYILDQAEYAKDCGIID